MNPEDIRRFDANLTWFNLFFDGLKQLFDKVVDAMVAEEIIPDHPQVDTNYYYYAPRSRPSIPAYYGLGMRGEDAAYQVYAILDPSLFAESLPFRREPSLVIVKHARHEHWAWYREYGMRIVQQDRVRLLDQQGAHISGTILGQQEAHFHAQQVLLDHFADPANVNEAIDREIVQVFRALPGWTG